ncbi:hypothetical protein AB833_07825 [Chromatiales bacterium (ex Bugula neritina AB1)]|nr:hypothetical protein AB833_07825 [Chromatiales bacterium (ex Bugula neritina AB1)]
MYLQTPPPKPSEVALWAARIPYIGLVALHHWFVIEQSGVKTRWEVWQSKAAGGTSWGHLHRDLMAPESWPHPAKPQLLQQWHADNATQLTSRIESSPEHYPWREQYRYWPGPNSNTYVQWVLQNELKLGWRAPGRGYVVFA